MTPVAALQAEFPQILSLFDAIAAQPSSAYATLPGMAQEI